MYKFLNNIAPDYLTERFMRVSETHNRQLRSADNDLLISGYSAVRLIRRSCVRARAGTDIYVPAMLRSNNLLANKGYARHHFFIKKVPYPKTKYYDNSFTVSGAKLCNSLPLNIKSQSIDSFKCSIKAHMFETNS